MIYSTCSTNPIETEAVAVERPRITDIHVRMDCNGCVQKIKKAVNSVDGVYDIYIDLPQQKLTVIGRADPERIVKAIKKVRKTATICSHTEVPPDQNSQPQEQPPPPEEAPQSEAPPPPPPEEPPKDEPPPPPQEPPPENPPSQNPPQETNPQPPPMTENPNPAPTQPEKPPHGLPNEAEEVHTVVYHHSHPPDHGYRYGYGNGGYYEPPHHPAYQERRPQPVYYDPPTPPRHVYHEPVYHEPPPVRPSYPELLIRPGYHEPPPPPRPIYHEPPPPRSSYHEPPPRPTFHEPPPPRPSYHESPPPRRASFQEPGPSPVYVTHSYNTSRPSPYITAYQYVESPPPPPRYTTYSRRMEMDNYSTDPYWEASSSGNASSLFSDENPNACTIA